MSRWKNIPKDISKYKGFVYLIENKINNKKYIGKKFYWNERTIKPLKNKKRKRHITIESDWEDYYGSSVKLKKDIELFGKHNFERTILKNCKTKWECAYYELVEQIKRNVLFDENYYNEIINVRLRKRKG